MRLFKGNMFWQYTAFPKSVFTSGSDYQINTVNTAFQFVDLLFF